MRRGEKRKEEKGMGATQTQDGQKVAILQSRHHIAFPLDGLEKV